MATNGIANRQDVLEILGRMANGPEMDPQSISSKITTDELIVCMRKEAIAPTSNNQINESRKKRLDAVREAYEFLKSTRNLHVPYREHVRLFNPSDDEGIRTSEHRVWLTTTDGTGSDFEVEFVLDVGRAMLGLAMALNFNEAYSQGWLVRFGDDSGPYIPEGQDHWNPEGEQTYGRNRASFIPCPAHPDRRQPDRAAAVRGPPPPPLRRLQDQDSWRRDTPNGNGRSWN